MIWLDGLDLPLFNLFNLFKLDFASQYPESSRITISKHAGRKHYITLPVGPLEAALRATSGPYAQYHYGRLGGRHLSNTLSAQAEQVAAGTTSPENQETISFIYHVVEGDGYSTIVEPGQNKPRKVTWTSKDTSAVPAWSKITHTSTSGEGDAFLVAINDRPAVESLGLLRDASTFSNVLS